MKEWTVMVYMAGNNNLSEDMVTGLKGMQFIADDRYINLLAAYECNDPASPTNIFEFNCERRNERLNANVVDQLRIRSSTDKKPQSKITDFVSWVSSDEKYNAQNYALIISGHSDGFLGKNLLRSNNAISKLTLPELREILVDARHHLRDDKKFALLGFDSCLMSMVEVGYELNDVAEIMVASEGQVPTSGWPYERVLSELIESKGNLSPSDFAKSIVDQFADFHSDYVLGGRSVSISACSMMESIAVTKQVSDLAEILFNLLTLVDESAPKGCSAENQIVRDKIRNLVLDSRYYSQAYLHDQAVDVLDFARALRGEGQKLLNEINAIRGGASPNRFVNKFIGQINLIQSACENIESACQKYVIAQSSCGPEYQFSTGASIFLPWTRIALDLVRNLYEKLQFAKTAGTKWLRFIDLYTTATFRMGSNGLPPCQNIAFSVVGHKGVGAKEYIGREVGAKEPVGREVGAKEHAGREVGAKEHAGREVGAKEHAGREVGAKEHAGREVGAKEHTSRGSFAGGDFEAFLEYFRRVRNYPMHADPQMAHTAICTTNEREQSILMGD